MDRDSERAAKIAQLNDAFRRSRFGVTITPGIQALGNIPGLLDEVGRFNDFTENNDPYGEHDFGTVYWHGEKIFWKIDYYDQALQGWHDPLSKQCRRVMTVMLAEEY